MANNFPCLWFKSEAEEALNYYVSIIPNSQIQQVARVNEAGPFPKGAVISVTAMLDGQLVLALNGNPQFPFSLATSLVTICETQPELDERWEKLSAGGQTMQCGWLTDRYGVAWQVTPKVLPELLSGDQKATDRVMAAMMQMTKMDIAELQRAYDGK